MKITMVSVLVDDQDRALTFYTSTLGFIVVHDIPLGEYRWIALSSSEDPTGTQLILEPAAYPAARPYREALVSDGIPFASFEVDDVEAEYARLVAMGVEFSQAPVSAGPATTAVLDDTVGNLIQILSMNP